MGTKAHITLLHLSDLQFGRNHRFGRLGTSDDDFDSLFGRLNRDLGKLRDSHGLAPNVLVVSGDLAEWGKKKEFSDALLFLEKLTELLELERRHVVIIPGNHDVNRRRCQSYFIDCEEDDVEPRPPFWPKWRDYVSLFERFYRDVPVRFTEDEPWTLFEMPDLRVVIAGLNSTWAESHRDEDHYGFLGERQLDWFQDKLGEFRGRGWLRIAAVHHNVVRGAVADDENLQDADGLKHLLGPYLNLVFHGH